MSSARGRIRQRSRPGRRGRIGVAAALAVLALGPARSDGPPDVSTLLPHLLQTLQRDRIESARWSWVESVVLEKRAPGGEIRSRTTEVYEVFMRDGRRMKRPISLDLADDSQGFAMARHEEARFMPGDPGGDSVARAVKDNPFEAETLLHCFHFDQAGREDLEGTMRTKVRFTPIDDCIVDGSRAGRLLQQLQGSMWIDEASLDVVRIEGAIRKPVTFGFGILGKVEQFDVTVERGAIAPSLHMMTHVSYRARGTSFIFHQFDVESVHDRSGFAAEPAADSKVAPPAGSAP